MTLSKGLSDLQLGDEKGTLNHLEPGSLVQWSFRKRRNLFFYRCISSTIWWQKPLLFMVVGADGIYEWLMFMVNDGK